MKTLSVAAVAACGLVLSGCGSDAVTTVGSPPATSTVAKVGEPLVFARADTKVPIGTIRILETAAMPAECLADPAGHGIGLRVEIDNPGELFLPRPDYTTWKVVDHSGFQQAVTPAVVKFECRSRYPEISKSQPASKTAGWVVAEMQQPNPTAIVYTPIVAEAGSTVSDIKFVTVAPKSATVTLP
ncbi:hypothetical protein [Nocardia sp. NPDC049149]|uniref:hypothetical protein n=1 Tax=Nocardia sp. NPDC049149 TaxID=3364315 RepID=UPI00371AE0F4